MAKVKAGQVSKAQYGKGGFEILSGGSHASGNDIPIGMMADGRQRTAEGEEGLAIFNKSQTRKYRKLLPDIVRSINHGTFENKYMRAYNMEGINIQQSGTDVSRLEKEVKTIREQGEYSRYVNGKGELVDHYKNLTRTFKC